MASSGSASAWVDSTHYVQLRLSWSQVSQDVANNRTTIRLTLQVVTGQYGAMYGSASLPWSISCNGQSVSGTWTIQTGANQTRTIRSWDVTIGHNSDGTKNFSASASVTFNMNFNGWVGAKGVSVSGTLNTIPRASAPSVSGTKQLGSKLTISTNRKSSAFTHTVKWSWAGKSGTIASNVGASCTWTPSVATFAPYLPNAGSATCTITCDTYNGGTKIGTKTTSFTLSIPSNVTPSVSAVTVTDTEGYQAKYGGLVSGKSHITIKVTGVGVYGSTIKSYGKKYNKNSEQSNTTGSFTDAPQAVGSIPIVGSVTDSRGRKASKSITVTVLAYDAPSLSGTTAARTPNDESSTVRVTVKGSTTNLGGKNTNTATVKIERRQQGTSAWTQVNSADRGVTWNYTLDIGGLSSDSVWEIRVTATDQLGTVTQTILTVSTASPIIDLKSNGKGLGVGVVSTIDNTMQVGWKLSPQAGIRMPYTYGLNNGTGKIWTNLGTFSNATQCDVCHITCYGGQGQNGESAQNQTADIFIKTGFSGSSSHHGVYVLLTNGFTDSMKVKVIENSASSCTVWVWNSGTYHMGMYTVELTRNSTWTHSGATMSTEPSGTACETAHHRNLVTDTSNHPDLTWPDLGAHGMVNKKLWEGSWTSGSVSIAHGPYRLFWVDWADAATGALLIKQGSSIRGMGGRPYVASNGAYAWEFWGLAISYDGNTCTIDEKGNYQFSLYYPSSGSTPTVGNRNTRAVIGIYGLL